MKVIQGKQAVLRPYLSEEQCVTPVQGHIARPGKPVDYTVKRVPTVEAGQSVPQKHSVRCLEPGRARERLVRQAEVDTLREHSVQTADTQALELSELPVESAVVKELSTVPLCAAEISMETGRSMDVTEKDDLTIEELFAQAMK